MDRNTLTGLFIIGVIIIVFSFWLQPSQQEIKRYNQQKDSIENVKKEKPGIAKKDTNTVDNNALKSTAGSGIFALADSTKEEFTTIENEVLKAKISNKGARVYSVELKKYKTWDGKPLLLCDGDQNSFGLKFMADKDLVNTNDLFFSKSGNSFSVAGTDSNQITFRLATANDAYIDYTYSLKGNSYLLGFDIKTSGMEKLIPAGTNHFDLQWNTNIPINEKDVKGERNNSSIYYQYTNEEMDYISEAKDESKKLENNLKWVSFKQHFFSSSLIAKDKFDGAEIKTLTDLSLPYVKSFSSTLVIPYKHQPEESFAMQFYFGPNQYKPMKKLGLGLENQIKLGWGFLKYINRWAVLPIFDLLGRINLNYGIIILILTILLKVVLLPLTYSSYMSAAKMRLLKPEVDELKEKMKDDQARFQQESMKLYRKAGVNPLGGCLPLLLQIPILLAFFNFFPSSIELRQQSFLWVKDLSAYDSIWDFGNIPIINTIYGSHVSLMCLLMTASTIIYTRLNNQISGANDQLKWMGYLMPIIFMGVLNNMPSGLNYYYFCANMITFGQQYIIRRSVDENKLHAQIQENKKRPESAKKSRFQAKLEELAKQSQAAKEQQRKARNK